MSRLPLTRKSWILLPRLMKESSSIVHLKTVNILKPQSLLKHQQPPLLLLGGFFARFFSSHPNFYAIGYPPVYPDFPGYVAKRAGPSLTLVSYNSLMAELIEEEDINNAMKLLSLMKANGCKPNESTYGELIKGFHKIWGFDDTVSDLFQEMLDQGLIPNELHYTCQIEALCRSGKLEAALVLLEKMETCGLRRETKAYNAIISCFSKTKRLREAQEFFEKMVEKEVAPDAATYTALIDGLCRNGKVDDAFNVFDEMHKKNCMPDLDTYDSLVYGLCSQGRVDEAMTLLEEMERKGTARDAEIYTTIVGRLCEEEGKTREAVDLWKKMEAKGLSPSRAYMYTPLIDAHCRNGNVDDALQLFDSMIEKGCSPEIKACVALICALCEEGRVIKATCLYEDMFHQTCAHVDEIVWAVFIDGLLDNLGVDACLEFINEMQPKCEMHVILEGELLQVAASADYSQAVRELKYSVSIYLRYIECDYLGF